MKKYRVLKEFVHLHTRKRYFPGDLYATEKASEKMISDKMLIEITADDTILGPDQVEKKEVAGNPAGIDFSEDQDSESEESDAETSDEESEKQEAPQRGRKRKGK